MGEGGINKEKNLNSRVVLRIPDGSEFFGSNGLENAVVRVFLVYNLGQFRGFTMKGIS